MGKKKLQRFEEMNRFERVFQPPVNDVINNNYHLKGKWNQKVFFNDNPIILELGCGKGEYTVGLARKFPYKNFIGVDIKGARIWSGARIINEDKISNAAFLRTRIEFISWFFAKNEVDEIWLTFPDPQLKIRRRKKRLCSSEFLGIYQKFVIDNGIIHLKTDSLELHNYTEDLLNNNNMEIIINTTDLYNSDIQDDIPGIQTYYEKQYLEAGKKINYLKFRLPSDILIRESGINIQPENL